MAGTEDSLLTPRLRLVPIGPDNAADLWLVHNDDAVVPWYDGWRPSRHEADDHARRIAESWRLHGVHKWMAYDRETGEVVGRGGLSRTPIDDDWGQLYAFLPDEPWVREAHESECPFRAHARLAGNRVGAAPRALGSGLCVGDRHSGPHLRVRRARGACRRVVHRAPQPALSSGDGAHRHALHGRDLQPRHR